MLARLHFQLLLAALDFRASGFRLQHTIKTIMKSNAYQLSARFPGEWNDRYLSYYPRHYARVMTGPETLPRSTARTGP